MNIGYFLYKELERKYNRLRVLKPYNKTRLSFLLPSLTPSSPSKNLMKIN